MSRKEYPKEVYETLILGGEGETPGVQVNLPWVLKQGEGFTACRNGQPIGINGILEGGPLVICQSDRLPFKDKCFEKIIANGVPIDCHAYLGPGYCSKELARVCRNGFCPPPKPSTFIDVGENLEIKIEDYQENE